MSNNHLDRFLASMSKGDVKSALSHLSETIALRSPIVPMPFEGKATVAYVLTQLFDTVDSFEPKLLLRDGADVIAVLTIRFGDHVIDAFDHIHLDSEGFIESMTVAWRPLPAVVAVQRHLAPKHGGKAMQLVPLDESGEA